MRPLMTDGTESARLLVVDDEATILQLLAGSLRFVGYDVTTASNGIDAVRAAAISRPDLVLLDVMMPDGDGFEVIERLRASGHDVPVIFLSARDELDARITGLALGGDDYITKPFSLDEVLIRIRAVLRRTRQCVTRTPVLRVADLEIDDDLHEVRRAGALVSLTPTEYRLLRFLMLNAGRVVSKSQILDHVWEYNPAGEGNVIEPCISYLRRKVDQTEPRLIHTIRGVGYVLRIPPP
jgi:two-component system, OmpR family, response regulator